MVVLVVSILIGVLIFALGVPLAMRRIGPNAWYGFRVGRALEDESAWFAANAASGRCLAFTGAAIILAATLNAILATNIAIAALINGLVMTLGIIIAMGAGFAALHDDDFPSSIDESR